MKNLEELQAIRESMKDRVSSRGIGASSDHAPGSSYSCAAVPCTSGHNKDIYNEFAPSQRERHRK
ncbi:MAG: hypothetical protein ACLUSP_00615 [Christensenellales bacterium]